MRKLGALIVAAGLGLGATAATTPAEAQNLQFGIGIGTPFYEPYYGPGPGYYGTRYGRYYEPRYSRYYEPRRSYRGSWGAHVEWCYDRYRSYDRSRDAFKGYDGRWHKCNSPFG